MRNMTLRYRIALFVLALFALLITLPEQAAADIAPLPPTQRQQRQLQQQQNAWERQLASLEKSVKELQKSMEQFMNQVNYDLDADDALWAKQKQLEWRLGMLTLPHSLVAELYTLEGRLLQLKSPNATQEQLAKELSQLEESYELASRMRQLPVEQRRQLEELLNRIRKLSGQEPKKTAYSTPEESQNIQEPSGEMSAFIGATEVTVLGFVVFACFFWELLR